jgi:hypothetical protein
MVFRGDNRDTNKLAYYADRVGPLDLNQPLIAAGKITLRRAISDSTTLLGFFHSRDSVTVGTSQSSGFPQSFLGVSVEGPSSEGFFVYPALHLAGGDAYGSGRDRPRILPDGSTHAWAIRYQPLKTGGGRLEATLDGKGVSIDVSAKDREAGTKFDRFGLVTTWIDGNSQTIFFDDLTYTSGPAQPSP